MSRDLFPREVLREPGFSADHVIEMWSSVFASQQYSMPMSQLGSNSTELAKARISFLSAMPPARHQNPIKSPLVVFRHRLLRRQFGSLRLLHRQFLANDGHRVLARGGMSNLNLPAQEKPIQPVADLGKDRIGARLLLSPPGAPPTPKPPIIRS